MKKVGFMERDFQGKVTRYMRKNAWGSLCYELKVSKTKTLPFSKFRDHQLPSLLKANKDILHYKIPDVGLLSAAPFDGFALRHSMAYVGVMYEIDKQQDVCYFVDIVAVNRIKNKGGRSIKQEDAKKYGIEINFKGRK